MKAFGAVGDGKADDTAAIQRAINECREVFFPAGTYVVSDTLRLRPDSRLFGEMWSIIKFPGDAAGSPGSGRVGRRSSTCQLTQRQR